MCIVFGSYYAPLTTHAQDSMSGHGAQFPQIAVTGRGEVKVSPDRATIQISVQTRASTAAAAAAENANKQQAVLAALRASGWVRISSRRSTTTSILSSAMSRGRSR